MKKRMISLLLALAMAFGMAPAVCMTTNAAEIASGGCGNNLTWVLDDSGTLTISGSGDMANFMVSPAWNDYCGSIVNVVIEEGVTSIGNYAFSRCDKLVSITIAETVTKIGDSAFQYCNGLTAISIPAGVTEISDKAFYECDKLTTVTLPDTIVSIGQQAFMGCGELRGCAIPESVRTIGKQAFAFCYALRNVEIPDGVTVIADETFYFCLQLVSVRIPGTVKSIGSKVFDNCKALSKVYFEGTQEQWNAVANQSNLGKAEMIYEPREQEPGQDTPSGDEEKEPIKQIASGTCGDNLKWVLDVSGRLTISGNGEMDNYASGSPKSPWYEFNERIFSVVIKNGVTSIGNYAFYCCDLTQIDLPASVKHIGKGAFWGCGDLRKIDIPEGVTTIAESTFYSCINLKTITLPASLTTVESAAFQYVHNGVDNVYFGGSAEQWGKVRISRDMDIYDTQPYNQPLLDATVHFDISASIRNAKMQVYTDFASLAVAVGDVITFRVAICAQDGTVVDPTGVTFQLSDNYTVKVLDTGIDSEMNHFLVQLQGTIEGTGYVTFSDSTTGNVTSLPLTVFENQYDAYTLDTVPVGTVFNGIREEGPLNFYNRNGLYVDSFQAEVTDSGNALVSFDVYNTNHTYAIVEVYDENGELYNAVLLEKMDYLNDGIKSVLWDGTGCVVRDLFLGNALTYKQETNFSKRTSVQVEVPKNGYIQITADSMESAILAVVNSADMLMCTLSLLKKTEGYVNGDFEIPKKLTEQLSNDDNFKDAIKGGKDFCKKLLKGFGKDAAITSKTVGGFMDTLTKNMEELNLLKLVLDSAKSTGVSIAEDTIKEMMGVFGDAMELVFTVGSASDLICQYDAYLKTVNGGVITIQNQGSGKRHCDNIVLESELDFDPEVALQVYSVTLDEALLEKVKNKDAFTYEMLTKYVTRTYNISLLKNGDETQHGGDVAVYIPVPYDLEYLDLNGHIKVFRIEEDGTMTDMDAVVEGDTIMFTTDHFSLYTLVFAGMEEPPEDSGEETESTKPNKKPSNKDNDDEESDENGSGAVVIVIVLVVLLAGGGAAAWFVLKKKKQQ